MATRSGGVLSTLRGYWLARRMKQLASRATEAIYAEGFNAETSLSGLYATSDPASLLRAHISIALAANLTEPLSDTDVSNVLDELAVLEPHVMRPDFDKLLELYRELADVSSMLRNLRNLQGQLAHKENEYSYKGGLWMRQNLNKGPISCKEREKLREAAQAIAALDRQIEQKELELLEEQDPEEYQRMKEELEARALQDEVEHDDALREDEEFGRVVGMIKDRIAAVIRDWGVS